MKDSEHGRPRRFQDFFEPLRGPRHRLSVAQQRQYDLGWFLIGLALSGVIVLVLWALITLIS